MKKAHHFKQKKLIIAPILGFMLVLIGLLSLFDDTGNFNSIVLIFGLVALLFGYAVTYEISADFNNKKHFRLFGVSVFKSKLRIDFPDYITVFSARHKQGSEWGPIAALGKERLGDSFVVRFFTGRKYFTVYRTKSLLNAQKKATILSELLGVAIKK